jgi:hypothetical protein
MDEYWAVIYGLIIVIFILLIKRSSNFSNEIPKTIWTFWNSDDFPKTVQKCIDTWRSSNPDYNIIILNKTNIKEYLPEIDVYSLKHNDSPARTSDFIRCHVLPKYGGVWVDASIIINKPLSTIINTNYSFTGYYLEGFTTNSDYPVLENWFFACTKGNEFVSKWRDAFMKLNNYETPEQYSEYIKSLGVDVQQIYDLNYLAMHVAAQYVFQKEMTPQSIKTNLNLLKAEDGPYKYLFDSDWNSGKSVESICKDNRYKNTPFIKLRGPERNFVETNDEMFCVFD